MGYDDYIFDLYGTLVDIHTDEGKPELWRSMAGWYSAYGADWTPEQLQQAYWTFVREEEQALAAEPGAEYPEIKLEKVFLRLLKEAPASHEAAERPCGAKRSGVNAPVEQTAGKLRLPVKAEQPWSGAEQVYYKALQAYSKAERAYYKAEQAYSKTERAWVEATANMFRVLSRDRLCCFAGVPEMLKKLKAQGKRVFLLSNAQSVFTMPELEQCGIAECFDDIFISSDRGIKKPEPRFLEELMQKHSMDPARSVMIGNDPLTDMAVAKACGIAGILVSSDGSDIAALLG